MSFSIEELEAIIRSQSSQQPTVAWNRSAPAPFAPLPLQSQTGVSQGPSGLFSPETSAANAAAVEALLRTLPQPAPKPAMGECQVCGETAMLLPCTLVAGKPCRHTFCKPCMSQWIAAKVEARQRIVVCLAVDCGHALNQADIARLSLDPAVPEAHTALMAETYGERLREMSTDPELKAWIDENARPCPKCSVLITRATSCNSVACPCGHRFCYCCGQERCLRNAPMMGQNEFHALIADAVEFWRETPTKSSGAAAAIFAAANPPSLQPPK